jgi:trimethylamine-N-oxide reductase (cytochrome c)
MFFEEMDYPAEGCAPIEFLYQQGSTLTNPPRYKRHLEAIKSPQIKTFFVAAPWFDRDCRYADIVLPATTVFEMEDLTEPASVGQYIPPSYIGLRSAVYTQQCVQPYGESRSDLMIYAELADRLGVGAEYMEGNTEATLLEKMFARTNIPVDFQDFKEKGYFVWPQPKDYQECKQFSEFYHDPEGHPLDTPSGKFEIFSLRLYEKYHNNQDIPPIPQYTPEIEGRSNEGMRKEYPLQMLMAHPKLRFHGKYNNCEWLRENYKVVGPDGYGYEPIWMNPVDAETRGLKDGDFVIAKNARGRVLAAVRVTRRMTPGVAWFSYGSWQDPLGPEEDAIDRGGDANILSNNEPMSIHHVGGAFNSVLFDVEKADLDEIAKAHPEGWAGKYRTWIDR